MSDWWSYALSDFLLFSPRVYRRLFELQNEAVWPIQVLTLAAGVAMVILVLRRPRGHGRLVALLLASAWALVAWSFFWQRYATINWAAVYVAPVFALEAMLLLVTGVLFGRLTFDWRGARGLLGLLLVAFALAGQPLLAPLAGRPLAGAEIFGIAPDPTVIATVGLLLLARGKWAGLLFPIPAFWCLVTGATLWALREPEAWIAPGAVVLAIATFIWRHPARDTQVNASS
jgi:Family of unknown function (DUF6064)